MKTSQPPSKEPRRGGIAFWFSPQRLRGLIPPPSEGELSEPRASREGGRARSARTGGAPFPQATRRALHNFAEDLFSAVAFGFEVYPTHHASALRAPAWSPLPARSRLASLAFARGRDELAASFLSRP